jgi:hypothetical protein
MSRPPTATKCLHVYPTPSMTYHMQNCTPTTACTHAPPTLNSNTTNPLLQPCHTSAPLDCAHSTIYAISTQQNLQQQSPPEQHLLHLPPLPQFTHLTNQPHHSIPIQSLPTSNPTMRTVMTPLHDPPGWPTNLILHVGCKYFTPSPLPCHQPCIQLTTFVYYPVGPLRSIVSTLRKYATGSFTP